MKRLREFARRHGDALMSIGLLVFLASVFAYFGPERPSDKVLPSPVIFQVHDRAILERLERIERDVRAIRDVAVGRP